MADFIRFTWNPPLERRISALQQIGKGPDSRSIIGLSDSVAQSGVQALRTTAPKRTGQFASSIQARQIRVNGQARISFVAPGPLAGWIMAGTQPHMIVGHQELSFYWQRTGRQLIVRSVQHPGTRPSDFVRRAMMVAQSDWRSALHQAGSELMQELRNAR